LSPDSNTGVAGAVAGFLTAEAAFLAGAAAFLAAATGLLAVAALAGAGTLRVAAAAGLARAAVVLFFMGGGAFATRALAGAFAFVAEGEDFAAAAFLAIAAPRAGGFISGLLVAMAFTPCEWRVIHPNGGLPAYKKSAKGNSLV
jgi:hypothetical protein